MCTDDGLMEGFDSAMQDGSDQPITPSTVWASDELHFDFDSVKQSEQPAGLERIMDSYENIVGVTPDIPPGPLFSDDYEQKHDSLFPWHRFGD